MKASLVFVILIIIVGLLYALYQMLKNKNKNNYTNSKNVDLSKFNFNNHNVELDDSTKKWNKMWNLWSENKIDSPIKELMTYDAEVGNGGHWQYFDYINEDGIEDSIKQLKKVLDKDLYENLKEIYNIYMKYAPIEEQVLDEEELDAIDDISNKCDDYYYNNEDKVKKILEEYAETIELSDED